MKIRNFYHLNRSQICPHGSIYGQKFLQAIFNGKNFEFLKTVIIIRFLRLWKLFSKNFLKFRKKFYDPLYRKKIATFLDFSKFTNFDLRSGELYADREYLEKLSQDETLIKDENGKSASILELITTGIKYLDTRTDFWRQQKPMYTR